MVLEIEFTAANSNGSPFQFKLNDSEIDYRLIRNHVSESVCIDAIEKIKRESKKKCAMIFGNCQTLSLRKILLKHFQFPKEYFFLTVPAVCQYVDKVDLIYGGGGSFYN
ncbi:MAG: hypothetical protein IJ575_08455 [Selenomonadaceae bacterium]|nr:hypothetical protein [Selenomonadaceae bacterium]